MFEHHLHSWLQDHLLKETRDNLWIFVVYKMLMKVIVHHQEYIEEHFHQDSTMRYSTFCLDLVNISTVLPVEGNKQYTRYHWYPTGHWELNDELKLSFKSTLVEKLDQREVGSSRFARGSKILKKVEALLENVS